MDVIIKKRNILTIVMTTNAHLATIPRQGIQHTTVYSMHVGQMIVQMKKLILLTIVININAFLVMKASTGMGIVLIMDVLTVEKK